MSAFRSLRRRLSRMSLRSRVSLIAAAVAAAVIFAVSASALVLAERGLRSTVDQRLVEAVEDAERSGYGHEPLENGPGDGSFGVPDRGRDTEFGRDFGRGRGDGDIDVRLRTFDRLGVTLAETNAPIMPIAKWELALFDEPQDRVAIRTVEDGDVPYRVAATIAKRGGLVYGIEAISSLEPTVEAEATLLGVILVVGVLGIGAALILGWLVGSAAVAPILRLADAASHVAETQDLAVHVAEDGAEEVARVARSFNSMMETLSEARAQQSRLVADAGHELRTPLTSLRTNVEVLASGAQLGEADRAALVADVDEQIAELSALVADLTDLAASDSAASAEFVDLRLDLVVADAVRRAERRNIAAVFQTSLAPAVVRGNAHLLERAVLNLCDNAAKWSPSNGIINVTMMTSQRPTAGGEPTVEISVVDQGPGISPEHSEKVFERFWRAPESRSMPGSGLGLSIVRQVVTSHGGSVHADTEHEGGARFVLQLPTVDPDTAER